MPSHSDRIRRHYVSADQQDIETPDVRAIVEEPVHGQHDVVTEDFDDDAEDAPAGSDR